MLRLLALCVLATLTRGQTVTRNLAGDTCQADQNSVTIEPTAEAMLVGILDMRGPLKDGVGCGQPDEVMMPAFEAMKWTLDRLNKNNGQIDGVTVTDSYVPGVRIGMTVYDTCGSAKVATEKVISSFENFYVPKRYCTKPDDKLELGVIGASRSIVSKELAGWLAHLKGPMVSFSSGTVSLGDPSVYPYFMRTIPANSVQAQVVVDLLMKLGWTKISIVHSDDAATKEDYEQVLHLANLHKICINQAIAVSRDMTTTASTRALNKLKESDTHGVVYIGFREEAYSLLSQISAAGAENLQWVFAGSISPDNDFVQKHGTRLRGFVAVSPHSKLTTEFRDYWTGIDARNARQDNPWFQEWYMTVHDCKLPGITYEPYGSKTSCQSTTLSRTNYVQNQYVQAAIDSVMTYAKALKNAHQAKCGGQRGVCQNLKNMNTDEFYKDYMIKVQLSYTNQERIGSWAQPQQRSLGFDPSGEVQSPSYDIMNYNNRAGTYTVVKVGDYTNRLLTVDLGNLDMYNDQRTTVLNSIPTYACAAAGCGICLTETVIERYIHIDGDVMINGMLPVHENSDGQCGGISAHGAQQAQAFIYAIEHVKNDLSILQDVDLGAIGFDDCGIGLRAETFIQRLESGVLELKSSAGDPYTSNDVPVYVAADSNEATVHAADLLTRLKVPQISFGATTTALSNLQRYPYFMRAIPSMSKQVDAIVQILKQMDWTYVQVVNTPDIHGRTGRSDFIRDAAANDICVTAAYEMETVGTAGEIVIQLKARTDAKVVVVIADGAHYKELLKAIQDAGEAGNLLLVGDTNWGNNQDVITGVEDAARGSITLDMTESPLNKFRTYLASLDVRSYSTNPWFRQWYERSYGCYLSASSIPMYTTACDPTKPITDAPGFSIDSSVLSVINSVYLSALGIHKSLEMTCGAGYQSVCNQFKNTENRANMIVSEMEKASFADMESQTFKLERREVNANFDIYNYRTGGYQKVGTFNTAGRTLQLNGNQIQFHSTPITSVCSGGPACEICLQKLNKILFVPGDIYLAGLFRVHEAGDSVYTCGDMKTVNGFQYTEVFAYALDQINSGNTPVKLNGVTLGGVGLDDCSSSFQASNIISGVYSGSLPLGKDGENVQPESIKAWISYGSEETFAAAEELSKRQVPLISPSASSTALSDIATFPTFYRTVPTDLLLAKSMVRLFLALDFGCVQIVYSPNSYGRAGYKTFRQNAKAEKLCVTQCLELETDGTYDEIFTKLTQAPSKAVVVIAEGDHYVPKLLEAKTKAGNTDVTFIGAATWAKSKSAVRGNEAASAKSITFGIQSPTIPAFDTYLQAKFPNQYTRNPWFEQYYEAMFQCDLPGNSKYGQGCSNPTGTTVTSSTHYEQENWLVSTMDAVYAAAQAIDLTLKDLCGDNYNGMCPQFVSQDVSAHIIGNLGKVSFQSERGETFRFNSRSGGVIYDVFTYNQQQYTKVGTSDGLSPLLDDPTALRKQYNGLPTTCTPCEECPLDIETSTDEEFIYLPGDILLGGMFDVHKRGLFPFTCDTIRPQYSYQLTEAFAFAIEQVNSKQGIFSDKLRGLTLGGVGLDSCESAIRAGNLIADFHSGVIQLVKNGETVDPQKVKAYIGGMSTERSMQMADVLNELKLPQISYGAAGMDLHNRKRFPLFSRTIPDNQKQVKGIIQFLKRYEINSVQVINSPGRYGEDGTNEFIKEAIKEKICVSQNITFRDNGTVTTYSASEVVNLLLNRPNSTVVVTFMETDYINTFLKLLHFNKLARNKFRFLGSELWGINTKVYRGAESEVGNAVVFNVDTGDVPGFDEYLAAKFPNTYVRNPWLPAYFQEVYQCTLPGSNLDYPKPCSVIDKSIVDQAYEQESYVMYVADAVYTAALGLDQTLREICGANYTGICDEWRSDMEPSKHLLKGIREAEFMDTAFGKEFKFVNDGESIRGFEIYSLERYPIPGAILEYNLIGRYQHKTDTDMELVAAPAYNFNYVSNCHAKNSCNMCPYMRVERTRYMQKPSSENLNIIGFFGVHHVGENYLTCGTMDVKAGLLKTMAFFYGLNHVNTDQLNEFNDKVLIGGLAIDSCSSVNRLRSELYSYLRDDGLCLAASYKDLFHPSTIAAYVTGDSESSIAAAELLTSREKVSVSQSMVVPVTTATEFPYLLRTLPNCGRQGHALFDVLKDNSWSYFLAVYSDDECGHAALDLLGKKAETESYCLGKSHMMTEAADVQRAIAILEDLNEAHHGKAVVLLTSHKHSVLILEAVKALDLQGRFVFIGVDTMTDHHMVPAHLQEAALGSVTLKLRQYPVPGFAEWIATMSDTNRLDVPEDWFHEFWQHMHECHIRNAAIVLDQYQRPCTMSETLDVSKIEQDEDVLHTIVSTIAVAKGLTALAASPTCAGIEIDDCMKNNPSIGMQLRDAMKTSFEVLPQVLGNKSFDLDLTDQNDAATNYVIYNYQKHGGQHEFVQVGECHGQCDIGALVHYDKNGEPKQVTSECPQDDYSCTCERRTEPISYRDPPGVADQFTEPFGIIIIALNLLGMLLSFILFFHFICFYPNKGGTTILGYVALFGVFILFAFNFTYVFYPHPIVCGVRRFCQGVVYAIIFGALGVKCMCTWKNTNVHEYDFQLVSKKRFTHPCGLIIITLCFITVQVAIATLWLILEPADSEYIIYFNQQWPRCTPHSFYNQGLVLSLMYVMFLMFMTLGFSGFSWPSTENNFEARYILGSTVFVMGTWMVWCIVSTMTAVRYRDGATAIGNIFCGYGLLFFVFFRKCYLLHKFRRQKFSRKLGDEKNGEGFYDNIAHEKDDDQMSDKSSGHGSL